MCLLQSVLHDLQSPHLISGCRAVGILDKLITGPFWRHLQTSTVSILEMSKVYTAMKEKFERWNNDAQCVLEHRDFLFQDLTEIETDCVSACVFESMADDHMAQELLEMIFKSFTLTVQRLLIDHLPGGKFHGVDDPKIIQETKSVPKTNVASEQDFAILDRLISQKPNASYESLLLFSQNKTADWLHTKTPEERERLLHAARSLTSFHRANFRKRREEIEMKRREVMKKREQDIIKKREKILKEKESLTIRIQQLGLWTTTDEVKIELDKLSTKKAKLEALKLQINFRNKVLNQSHAEKEVFQFSRNCQVFQLNN